MKMTAGCVMNETVSGEPMTLKLINEINEKMKFLYNKYLLTHGLRRMGCNAPIKPHFNYACPSGTLTLM